ncbi:hypothetical protein ACMHYB_60575 [Sorangium sp. So ce1128]
MLSASDESFGLRAASRRVVDAAPQSLVEYTPVERAGRRKMRCHPSHFRQKMRQFSCLDPCSETDPCRDGYECVADLCLPLESLYFSFPDVSTQRSKIRPASKRPRTRTLSKACAPIRIWLKLALWIGSLLVMWTVEVSRRCEHNGITGSEYSRYTHFTNLIRQGYHPRQSSEMNGHMDYEHLGGNLYSVRLSHGGRLYFTQDDDNEIVTIVQIGGHR